MAFGAATAAAPVTQLADHGLTRLARDVRHDQVEGLQTTDVVVTEGATHLVVLEREIVDCQVAAGVGAGQGVTVDGDQPAPVVEGAEDDAQHPDAAADVEHAANVIEGNGLEVA